VGRLISDKLDRSYLMTVGAYIARQNERSETPMTNKKFLLPAGLIILNVVMIVGLHWNSVVAESTPARNQQPIGTIPAEPVEITREVTVSGSVVARQSAVVSSQISGYVLDLMVMPGDHVHAGQTLLRIDTKELAERVAQARAALESAKANLEDAKKNFDRYTPLFESHAIAQAQYDAIRTNYKVAQAEERRAEAALKESKAQLAYGDVRSPFDGIIADKSVNIGDYVAPNRPLLTVYIPDTLELVAPVAEQYAPYVTAGTQVKVSIPSLALNQPDRIREVIPQINEQTRTITVKAPISGSPGLTPGLYGTLSFRTVISEVIAVPSKAVRSVGQLTSVRVLKNGEVETVYVKTGKVLNDGKIEILSGLKPGELVVTD
jgi:RND family efflux transporter MFP subunit